MSAQKRVYRTADGRADFHFTFTTRPFSREVRIYVDHTPPYGSRSTGLHDTHRYRDVNGAHYVCFDPMPSDMTTAYQVAKLWAERTWQYIQTGQSF